MNQLVETLQTVLHHPEPAGLVRLQEALLAASPDSLRREQALEVAGHFHEYLLDWQGKLTARQYSELASWFDIAAVGLVAFEGLMRGEMASFRDLLVGVMAESTMVLGSRQHIKSWQAEERQTHERASWFLRQALWRLSEETQPELTPEARLEAIRRVLPATGLPAAAKTVLLGRLFQAMLLIRVGWLAAGTASSSQAEP